MQLIEKNRIMIIKINIFIIQLVINLNGVTFKICNLVRKQMQECF